MLKLFLIIFLVSANICFAEDKISSIEVEGNLRVDKSTIENYLYLKKSKNYSEILSDSSVKKLFETGFFEDVTIKFSNGKLIVKVKENPMINQITFEGNKRLTKVVILEQFSLKARSIYSKTKLQQDINKLIELYHREGCYDVKLDPKIIQLDNNRINLVFEINEGPKTLVKNIFFIGNKSFSNNELHSIINTKETRWYNFWTKADNYDADIVEVDKQMLQRFYGSKGYFDCKILSAVAELNPARDGFIISFSIEEGQKYNFGTINIENRVKSDSEDLSNIVTTKKGELFNIEQIEQSVDLLIKDLNDKGFAFIDVEPSFERLPDEQIVNVNYLIAESQKAYVNKINIIGNVRTQDHVIRRELKLSEGDPFNATKIDRSEQAVKDLDYFKNVQFDKYMSQDKPGDVDIDIKLEEKSTAKFNLGGGITTEGKNISPIIQLTFSEDNLFGTGKKISASVDKSKKSNGGEISFTDPFFLDKDLSAGISLFGSKNAKADLFPYRSSKVGSSVHMGYGITDHLYHTLRYSIIKDDISNVTEGASDLIKLHQGKTVTSLIGHNFIYNRTNSRIKPTKGYWLKFDESVAGLGGDSKFINHEVGAGYYYPIKSDKLVFKLVSNAGNSYSYSNRKRINPYEGFYLGGIGENSLRGFETGGIGPRDSKRNSLGGRLYYKSTAELNFPLGFSKDFDVSGVLFFDAGSLQDANLPKEIRKTKKNEIFDDKSLRMSTGLGIVWNGPVGPVEIYVPFVLAKKKYDIVQKFHIKFFSMDF